MQASEVMNTHPITLKSTDKIKDAMKYIMERRYRSLPVVDEDFCYLGMFDVNCLLKKMVPKAVMDHGLENVSFIHESQEDVYERFSEAKDQPISVCINRDIQFITPDTPLTKTLLQLHETKSSIPVVEHSTNKLLGMISYWDIGDNILSTVDDGDATKAI